MHLLAHALHCIAYAIIFAAKYYKFPFYQGVEMTSYLALAVMAAIALSHMVFVKCIKPKKHTSIEATTNTPNPVIKEGTKEFEENDFEASTKLGAQDELFQYPTHVKRVIIKRETIEIYTD